ncbi:hypothetical protein ES288_D02G263200v1 [Gossypium darwinii]|nr:hypothetical protein ES288_D02G263200v1 [Gossypium darwinii]
MTTDLTSSSSSHMIPMPTIAGESHQLLFQLIYQKKYPLKPFSKVLRVIVGFITLCRNKRNMVIQHGWDQFYKDHSLGDNDLLVFRHNGNMCFDVQIFDKTGVERKTGPMTGKHRDCSVEIKEEDDANQKNIPCPPVCKKKSKGKHCKAAIDFSSKFPYFKRCLTRCNVEHPFLLSVPSSFAKAKYLPETKKEFIFSATKQGYWKVGFVCSEIDKVFSHGWRKFVRDNELKVGNNCVFELWLLEKSKSIFSTSFICNV